jgi:ADP-ribose pyrophosphatase YjhB (NUDIX family)
MSSPCDNKSVGIIVKNNEGVLLIERKKFPFGFAAPAGHIDDHGSFEDAAEAELKEETGLTADSLTLLLEERKENKCRREGGSWHYWKVYEAEVSGNLSLSKSETKQAGWYNYDDLMRLAQKTQNYLNKNISDEEWEREPGLEPVWFEFFKELKILPK